MGEVATDIQIQVLLPYPKVIPAKIIDQNFRLKIICKLMSWQQFLASFSLLLAIQLSWLLTSA